jgi:hypothetical protein
MISNGNNHLQGFDWLLPSWLFSGWQMRSPVSRIA